MFQFNKIDVTDTIAIIALSIALVMAIVYGMNELSMSLATGFFGYVGGVATTSNKKEKEKTDEKVSNKES